MTTTVISGTEYVVNDCDRCEGSGLRDDPTDADKANAGPFAGKCTTCSGRGKLYRAVWALEIERRDQEALKVCLAEQEIGDMPDWMS